MGPDGDGGPAADALLSLPIDVTVGPDGRVYILDFQSFRIRRIDEGRGIDTVLGSGELGDVTPGPARETDLNHLSHAIFEPGGTMLVAAWHNGYILRVDLEADRVEIVAGTGERRYHGEGGPATDAAFDLPSGLARVGGDLLVTDQANHVIRAIDEGGFIRRWAGRCVIGACAPSEASPCADSDKLVCPGTMFECVPPCVGAFEGDGGPAADARFSLPFGASAAPGGRLAVGPDGSIFIADTMNNRVRRIDPAGRISTVAGTGEPGTAGDSGPATSAQLDGPADVAVAPDGTLYIADMRSACIRAVGLDGVLRTVAGVCGSEGDGPVAGEATSVRLRFPHGIDVTDDGRLFIADTGNHRIRVVVLR
jgi:serine/threonine-protein kinase